MPQSVLPTGGTICYNCLTKINKWGKLTKEIANISEDLTKLLQAKLSSLQSRHKHTQSELEMENILKTVQNSQDLVSQQEASPDVLKTSADVDVSLCCI